MKQKAAVPAESPDSLPRRPCSRTELLGERLYAEQIPALWRFGSVMVADHTSDASVAAIAG